MYIILAILAFGSSSWALSTHFSLVVDLSTFLLGWMFAINVVAQKRLAALKISPCAIKKIWGISKSELITIWDLRFAFFVILFSYMVSIFMSDVNLFRFVIALIGLYAIVFIWLYWRRERNLSKLVKGTPPSHEEM